MQAEREQQVGRIATQRQHVAVGGFDAAIDLHAGDLAASVFQPLDLVTVAKGDTCLRSQFAQALGEQAAVAGLVFGQAQCAGHLRATAGQSGLELRNLRRAQQLVRHAVLGQHFDVLRSRVKLLLGAEQLGGAELAAFEFDPGLGTQCIEAVATVVGHAHHARLVHRIPLGGAVAQHLAQPRQLA